MIEFEEDNATEYTTTPIDAATTPTNANVVYYTPVPITATATATATATLSPINVQGGSNQYADRPDRPNRDSGRCFASTNHC